MAGALLRVLVAALVLEGATAVDCAGSAPQMGCATSESRDCCLLRDASLEACKVADTGYHIDNSVAGDEGDVIENKCAQTASSPTANGYVVPNVDAGTPMVHVGDLGTIACDTANDYEEVVLGTDPVASCASDQGTFTFSGCQKFYSCEATTTGTNPSATGYGVQHSSGTTVRGLGTISCITDYGATGANLPIATCASPGGATQQFVFSGCADLDTCEDYQCSDGLHRIASPENQDCVGVACDAGDEAACCDDNTCNQPATGTEPTGYTGLTDGGTGDTQVTVATLTAGTFDCAARYTTMKGTCTEDLTHHTYYESVPDDKAACEGVADYDLYTNTECESIETACTDDGGTKACTFTPAAAISATCPTHEDDFVYAGCIAQKSCTGYGCTSGYKAIDTPAGTDCEYAQCDPAAGSTDHDSCCQENECEVDATTFAGPATTTGYTITNLPADANTLTTVTAMNTIICTGASHYGTASVVCTTDGAGNDFTFSGCSPIVSCGATPTCDEGYKADGTKAAVDCAGVCTNAECCEEKQCEVDADNFAGTEGYTITTLPGDADTLTTVTGLAGVSCTTATHYGSASVVCETDGAGNDFTFSGCSLKATCDTITCLPSTHKKDSPADIKCKGNPCIDDPDSDIAGDGDDQSDCCDGNFCVSPDDQSDDAAAGEKLAIRGYTFHDGGGNTVDDIDVSDCETEDGWDYKYSDACVEYAPTRPGGVSVPEDKANCEAVDVDHSDADDMCNAIMTISTSDDDCKQACYWMEDYEYVTATCLNDLTTSEDDFVVDGCIVKGCDGTSNKCGCAKDQAVIGVQCDLNCEACAYGLHRPADIEPVDAAQTCSSCADQTGCKTSRNCCATDDHTKTACKEAEPGYNLAGTDNEMVFENICTAPTTLTPSAGYSVTIKGTTVQGLSAGTTGLGTIACVVGTGADAKYEGSASAKCLTAGGDFTFSGCTQYFKCTAFTSQQTGYAIPNLGSGTVSVTSLGTITCGTGYADDDTSDDDNIMATCAADDDDFALQGCAEVGKCDSYDCPDGYTHIDAAATTDCAAVVCNAGDGCCRANKCTALTATTGYDISPLGSGEVTVASMTTFQCDTGYADDTPGTCSSVTGDPADVANCGAVTALVDATACDAVLTACDDDSDSEEACHYTHYAASAECPTDGGTFDIGTCVVKATCAGYTQCGTGKKLKATPEDIDCSGSACDASDTQCCEENDCNAPGAMTGYNIANDAGTDVTALGQITCDTSTHYDSSGITYDPRATCDVDGEDFAFFGCTVRPICSAHTCADGSTAKTTGAPDKCTAVCTTTECCDINTCTAETEDPDGYDIATLGTGLVTVASMGVSCATNYYDATADGAVAGAACLTQGGSFTFDGCEARAKCSTYACATGYKAISAAATTNCDEDPCTEADDMSTCCDENTCNAPGSNSGSYALTSSSGTTVSGIGVSGCKSGYVVETEATCVATADEDAELCAAAVGSQGACEGVRTSSTSDNYCNMACTYTAASAAVATCNTDNGDFTFSGCKPPTCDGTLESCGCGLNQQITYNQCDLACTACAADYGHPGDTTIQSASRACTENTCTAGSGNRASVVIGGDNGATATKPSELTLTGCGTGYTGDSPTAHCATAGGAFSFAGCTGRACGASDITCVNGGTPAGKIPDCTCTCPEGYSGATCSEGSPAARVAVTFTALLTALALFA